MKVFNRLISKKLIDSDVEIYTCIKGKIYTGSLINETELGYRVSGGIVPYGHMVFKDKLRSGWLTDEQKPFYTEYSFMHIVIAREIAIGQILSMENYYKNKIFEMEKLKGKVFNGNDFNLNNS